MGTPDIAEKLLAAIEQRESKARSLASLPRYKGTWGKHLPDSLIVGRDHLLQASDREFADYLLLVDFDDTLRHCAADREIVEQHRRVWITPGASEFNDAHLTSEPMPVCASCRPETMFRRADSWPCRTLLALARGYGVTP